MGIKKQLRNEKRKFLGKTENFKDKEERSFFQRMLKAYLKGGSHFSFGRSFNHESGKYEPILHLVNQS